MEHALNIANTHMKTLQALFHEPVRPVKYRELEGLLLALGFMPQEGRGSRVRFFAPDGAALMLHKPHPRNEISGRAVRYVREFLHEHILEQ